MSSICWAATIIVAWRTGTMIRTKSASVAHYRRDGDDEWAPFIEEIYERGNRHWGYVVPTGAAERDVLGALCARTLAFENHYLTLYRAYLLQEVRADNRTGRLSAIGRLGTSSSSE